jgi:hypothetical protein
MRYSAGRARSARRVREDIAISGCVGIEIVPRRAHPLDMGRAVRPEQRLFRRFIRRTPFPAVMPRAQMRNARADAPGPFRMTRRRVFGAARIVKKDHVSALHESAEVRPIATDQKYFEHCDDNSGRDHCRRCEAHTDMKDENVNDNRSKNR